MQFTIALIAMAAAAFAAPHPDGNKCTPATYACAPGGGEGWIVCNTSGEFEVSLLFMLYAYRTLSNHF